MSLYIIAIGGTGAKVAESVVHAAASGLLNTDNIRILFVDPDMGNGNLHRTMEAFSRYAKCHNIFQQIRVPDRKLPLWMQPSIQLFKPPCWSPVGDQFNNRTLGDLFSYDNYRENDRNIKSLFDVLFTEQERKIPLELGFRGRPAIGSAVVSQLELDKDQKPWSTFFNEIERQSKEETKPRIFLCGSAFGGTGASGFPTLGRLIHEFLSAKEEFRQAVKLGGVLLLPYFEFAIPKNVSTNGNEIYADPQRFLLNTEAALRYYRVEAEGTFDNIYLLGSSQLSQVEKFGLGSTSQRNASHYIELYSALAAQHFLTHDSQEMGEAVLMSCTNANQITWNDFSKDVKQGLVNTARFAYLWTTDIAPRLNSFPSNSYKKIVRFSPWVRNFFSESGSSGLPSLAQEIKSINPITEWCNNYLEWLTALQTSSAPNIQLKLFSVSSFNALRKRTEEYDRNEINFSQLIVDKVPRDTISDIKSKLVSCKSSNVKGIAGLAMELYGLCS